MGGYFGGEPVGRADVEVRLGKLKNEKAADKDEITEEMIKGGGDRVVEWLWRLCNMAFENGAPPKDWRATVIVTLYESKGERTECSNYGGISLLSVVRKIYAGILVYGVPIVTEGLIDDEQGCLRAGRGVCRSVLQPKEER